MNQRSDSADDSRPSSPITFAQATASDSETESDSPEPPADIEIFPSTAPQLTRAPIHDTLTVIDMSTTETNHDTPTETYRCEDSAGQLYVSIGDLPADQRIIIHCIKFSITSLVIMTLAIAATLLGTWLLCAALPDNCSITTRIQSVVANISIYFFAGSLITETVCAVAFVLSTAIHRRRHRSRLANRNMLDLTCLDTRHGESK